SDNLQPTENVSPTTAHCGSPIKHSTLPMSCIKPVSINQSGCPSARIASAVCSKCCNWSSSISGSESSTSVFKNSIASQTLICLRLNCKNSFSFSRTKSKVWYL